MFQNHIAQLAIFLNFFFFNFQIPREKSIIQVFGLNNNMNFQVYILYPCEYNFICIIIISS